MTTTYTREQLIAASPIHHVTCVQLAIDEADRLAAEPAGAWVRPGDNVQAVCIFTNRVLFVHPDQSHQLRDGNSNIRCWLDSGATTFMRPDDLRLSGRPVLGVRAGEFTEDEMCNAVAMGMNSVIFKQHKSLGEIVREIREARP